MSIDGINLALLQEVREHLTKQSFVAAGDPSMDPAAAGGMPPGDPAAGGMPPGDPAAGGMPPGDPAAGGMPPGDPAAGGMPPGDPAAGGGDPMAALQPVIQQMVQQAVTAQGGAGGAGGGGGGSIKPKIDINIEIMQIKKLLAKLCDAMGVQIPASDMVATPEDLTEMAAGGPGAAAATPDPAAGGGGLGQIGAIQPMKAAQDDYQEFGEVYYGSSTPGVPTSSASSLVDRASAILAKNRARA